MVCRIQVSVLGFPGGAVVKNLPASARRHRRYGFDPWVRKIPWRRKWQPTPVFFARRIPWTGTVHGSQRIGHN